MMKVGKNGTRSAGSARDRRQSLPAGLSQVNLNAAGIDVGASSHFVAVPEDRWEPPVRKFHAYTADLYRLADWLAECGIKTVAMESTGVYWIPLFGVLEERGFEVLLVDPRRMKSVPGRKTDVLDCQWLQQPPHLRTAFRRLPSPTERSAACGVTCGSVPCWWSTQPTTSSTCTRLLPR